MLHKIRGWLRGKLDDPYLTKKAYPEPTVCPTCGLIYHKKHWKRDEGLKEKLEREAKRIKCPSCRKIEDHYPMGILTISGSFFLSHKEEINNIIKNTERKEILRNPLDRIMSLKEEKEKMIVETTSENLALALGKALSRAYKGKLEIRFSEDQKMVRVFWER
ncbi:MAG: BCAM0308 family protein [candidate division WOR-3 bacterium]